MKSTNIHNGAHGGNDKRRQIIRLVLAYFRGNADAEQRRELEEWAAGHEKRRELLERLQNRQYVGRELAEYQEYDSQKGWEKLSAALPVQRRKILGTVWRYAACAAILLCMGVSAWWFLQAPMQRTESATSISYGRSKAVLFLESGEAIELETERNTFCREVKGENFVNDGKKLTYKESKEKKTAEWHTLKVPRGGEFVLKLADGTVVTLNADSKIYYPSQFVEGEREVVLEGEAFFEVARDSLRPFTVKTEGMNVRVLGTHFNLKAYPDEHEQTTLVAGSVEVSFDEQHVLLHPGEQATRVAQELKVEEVDVTPYIAWKHDRFIFKNEPLEEVLKKLERWYDIEVFIQNPKLKEKRFTGNLPKYENIEHILKILALTTNIHFELKDRTLVVLLE